MTNKFDLLKYTKTEHDKANANIYIQQMQPEIQLNEPIINR